jgi:hypothetical protein
MSDIVVVDASLAIKWVLIEQDSDTALMLLAKWANVCGFSSPRRRAKSRVVAKLAGDVHPSTLK